MTSQPRDVVQFQLCAGGCGNDMVPVNRFACGDCFDELPASIRDEYCRDGSSSPLVARAILWWKNTGAQL